MNMPCTGAVRNSVLTRMQARAQHSPKSCILETNANRNAAAQALNSMLMLVAHISRPDLFQELTLYVARFEKGMQLFFQFCSFFLASTQYYGLVCKIYAPAAPGQAVLEFHFFQEIGAAMLAKKVTIKASCSCDAGRCNAASRSSTKSHALRRCIGKHAMQEP